MPDTDAEDLAFKAAEDIARLTGTDSHDIAVTLGSGWHGMGAHLGRTLAEIPAEEVTGFRPSPVQGHAGVIRSVETENGARILVIGARTHLYEGHGVAAVVHSVRVAAAGGATTMILTNGAGSVRPDWAPGTAVLIKDHINLTAESPIDGARFVDLTDAYSPRLRSIAHAVKDTLPEAVYVQMPGPHYETPAEVRMLRGMGGDVVGMSTALETIAAREAGLDVLGLSLVTNLAAGVQEGRLSHQEVITAGQDAAGTAGPLLAELIKAIAASK